MLGDSENLVSIIMPFLNAGPFIREAVDSVRAQSHSDWELLLVDDGSDDSSRAIASEYERLDDRIRCLQHPGRANLGASASRNLAIRQSRGRYIAFLDADDLWLPHKLAEQIPLLEAHPEAGMLCGVSLIWHGWTHRPEDRARDYLLPLGVPLDRTIQPPELLIRRIRGRAASPATCSVIIRREVVERVGGFEDEFRRLYTDQVFYAKVFLDTPVHVSSRVWDRYRIHADSSCSVGEREGAMRAARRAWLEWIAAYLEARGSAHGRVWRELRREIWLDDHPRVNEALTRARRGWRVRRRALAAPVRRLFRRWPGRQSEAAAPGRTRPGGTDAA